MARTIIALLLLSACSAETTTFASDGLESGGAEPSSAAYAATGGASVALGTGGAAQATGGAPGATGGAVAATGGRSTGGVTATGGVTVTIATGGARATGGTGTTGGAGINPSDAAISVCSAPYGGCKAQNGIEGGGGFDPTPCGANGEKCFNCPVSPYLPLNSSQVVMASLEPTGAHVEWCQNTAVFAWCLLPSGFRVVQCRPPV
jgi:hypothetical protein